MYKAHELVWVDTSDVRVGDRVACLLSDAEAYPEVQSWTDRVLDLSRCELPNVTHRTFYFDAWVPWWVDVDFRTHDLAGKTLIVARPESTMERSLSERNSPSRHF